MQITPILKIAGTSPTLPTPETGASGQLESLGSTFQQALDSLSRSEGQTDRLMEQLAAGEDVDIHQLMVAMEETDVNFRVAMAIRDRLVEAYREVMRMAV